ncbi:MAG: NAD+ synthase [Archaeoglobaceae archaeon]|nr:NAD+ synthase [Archaeoglobaceae archaeon]MDW8117360.1 NAD+ synthase [Archaeoglobaceae archaeon]
MKWKIVADRIIDFIREQVRSANATGVVLGLSGGIDSAVVAFLSVKALGKEKVLALIMPEKGITSEKDVDDAIELAKMLGIEFRVIEISDIVKMLIDKLGKGNESGEINLKPRIRMLINYYFANSLNRLVVGTGNKSEISIGYFTKFGDGGVDIQPIGDLYKTEIFEFARFLGIPEKIIRKKPTAGLWVGQTDEGEIGMSYAELDETLKQIEKGVIKDDEKFRKVIRMVENSKHKREMPPVAKLRDLI